MKIGYIRISTYEQNQSLQKDALKKDGCEKLFNDTASGKDRERAGLQKAIDFLRKGDVLVVWRLDRLGRSLRDLIEIMATLERKGAGLKSIKENIDTTTTGGRLIFHVFGALSEFEREVILERTQAGLKAARARGRSGGRPKKLTDDQIKKIKELHRKNEKTVPEICQMMGVSRSTLYRTLQAA